MARKTADKFIEEHTYINYCEAIIYPDGTIEYASPSHIEALIRETKESMENIYNKMPIQASPIEWLSEYTKCIPVWTQGYILPQRISIPQKIALNKLIKVCLVEPKSLL